MIHGAIVSFRVAMKNTNNTDVDIITGSFILVFYSLQMFSRLMPIGYWPRGGRNKVYIMPVSWVRGFFNIRYRSYYNTTKLSYAQLFVWGHSAYQMPYIIDARRPSFFRQAFQSVRSEEQIRWRHLLDIQLYDKWNGRKDALGNFHQYANQFDRR